MKSKGRNTGVRACHCLYFVTLLSVLLSCQLCFFAKKANAKIWKIEQLSQNYVYDGWVDMDGPHIAWRGIGENGYIAILYMDLDDRITHNLTMDRLYGDFGYPSVSNGQVCWRRIAKNEDRDSIIFWDGANLIVIDEYDRGPFGKYGYPPSYSSVDPSLSGGEIAYAKWDGNDYEIYYWDGSVVVQLTDNHTDDYEPQVHQGTVSWTGWGGDGTTTDVFYWDGTTISNISNRNGVDEDSNIFDGIIVNSGVTDTSYNTDIFLWNGIETKQIVKLLGFDFEPQIDESLVTWMSWPDGMGNSSVARIWDGYKLFTVDRLPEYVYDPHPGKNGFVFVSDDTDPELFFATFVNAVYAPELPNGEIVDVITSSECSYVYDGQYEISILTREIDDSLTKVHAFNPQGYAGLIDWTTRDTLLFLVTDNQDIQIYDLIDKTNPVLLNQIKLQTVPVRIHLADTNLFVLDPYGSVTVYNISSPQTAYVSSTFNAGSPGTKTCIHDNKLFVLDQGLRVFDVSNPESPTELLYQNIPVPSVKGLAVEDDKVIILDSDFWVYIYQVVLGNSASLSLLGEVPIPVEQNPYENESKLIEFIGDYLFVNTGADGIFVIDMSDPTNPTISERIDTFGYTFGFDVGEHFLYTANGNEGLVSVDINDYMETIYEDAEDGQITGWAIYDDEPSGSSISNIYDTGRQSRVIELSGRGIENGYQLLTGDHSAWGNKTQFQVEWSMKMGAQFSIYVEIETTAGKRYLNYTAGNESRLGADRYIQYGLGSNLNDGEWHTITRNLQNDFEEAQRGENILSVSSILVRGNGLLDDIKLTFAEEQEQSGTSVYEDAEDSSTAGWTIYDNASGSADIVNIYEPSRASRVIHLNGDGLLDGFKLLTNEYRKWNNTDEFVIEWSMHYLEPFSVFVDVTTSRGQSYLNYTLGTENHPATEKYIHYGLGTFADNGHWHTIVRDLQADFLDIFPEDYIIEVNGFLIRGSGLVDDILLRREYKSLYEDGEDGTTEGWMIYDDAPQGATIRNIYDETRNSRVIQVSGYGKENGFKLLNDSLRPWENSSQTTISWSMNLSESFSVYVDVDTSHGQRYLNYTPGLQSNLGTGTYIHYGLGGGLMEGQWITIVRNLQADIEEAQPGVELIQVNAFLIRGNGLFDDIYLE